MKGLIKATDYDNKVYELVTRFPELSTTMKGIIFFLNLILPGIGTIVLSQQESGTNWVVLADNGI